MERKWAFALCLLTGAGLVGWRAWPEGAKAQPAVETAQRESLVWSDEFTAPGGAAGRSQPNPANWRYETGGGGWGNAELETYCAWGSNAAPCRAAEPNAYVGKDGYLHIVARRLGKGVYTSARLTSEGLQSFQYGRIEARIRIPRGEGMWPAFWMLGDNIEAEQWPGCGEFDIMENIGKTPETIYGSIHGTGFTGGVITNRYSLPGGQAFGAGFHVYGMRWSPGKVRFYVDRPDNVYATETRANLPAGAVWPFDRGKFFFLLNLAVGGEWPGAPDARTHFPATMLVDYVRVYAEPGS